MTKRRGIKEWTRDELGNVNVVFRDGRRAQLYTEEVEEHNTGDPLFTRIKLTEAQSEVVWDAIVTLERSNRFDHVIHGVEVTRSGTLRLPLDWHLEEALIEELMTVGEAVELDEFWEPPGYTGRLVESARQHNQKMAADTPRRAAARIEQATRGGKSFHATHKYDKHGKVRPAWRAVAKRRGEQVTSI